MLNNVYDAAIARLQRTRYRPLTMQEKTARRLIEEAGKRIAKVRLLRGYKTQADLGAVLGVSHQVVSTWERGRSYPLTPDWIKLREVLRVPLDYLMTGDPTHLGFADYQALAKPTAKRQRKTAMHAAKTETTP